MRVSPLQLFQWKNIRKFDTPKMCVRRRGCSHTKGYNSLRRKEGAPNRPPETPRGEGGSLGSQGFCRASVFDLVLCTVGDEERKNRYLWKSLGSPYSTLSKECNFWAHRGYHCGSVTPVKHWVLPPPEFLVQKLLGNCFLGFFSKNIFLIKFYRIMYGNFLVKYVVKNKVICSFKLRLEIYGNFSIKLRSCGIW